jgi:hypothetical protein
VAVSKALLAERSELRKEAIPLTVDDVLNGDIEYFHDNFNTTVDGICAVWRRNGKMQTWKTRPQNFRQPVKHGLYQYHAITHLNVSEFHDGARCPLSNDL